MSSSRIPLRFIRATFAYPLCWLLITSAFLFGLNGCVPYHESYYLPTLEEGKLVNHYTINISKDGINTEMHVGFIWSQPEKLGLIVKIKGDINFINIDLRSLNIIRTGDGQILKPTKIYQSRLGKPVSEPDLEISGDVSIPGHNNWHFAIDHGVKRADIESFTLESFTITANGKSVQFPSVRFERKSKWVISAINR